MRWMREEVAIDCRIGRVRALDLARVRGLLATPLVIDLRNIYQPDEMAAAGLSYLSVGRPTRRAQPTPRGELRTPA